MPRRFRFSLQAVLDQREALEEVAQRRLAELERERVQIEERIRGYQRSIGAVKHDLRAHLAPAETDAGEREARAVSLAEVRLQAGAALGLVAKAQHSVLELAGLGKRLDAARLELIKAAADRKAVELLKAKQYEAWQREEARREQAQTDELNTNRYARREGPA